MKRPWPCPQINQTESAWASGKHAQTQANFELTHTPAGGRGAELRVADVGLGYHGLAQRFIPVCVERYRIALLARQKHVSWGNGGTAMVEVKGGGERLR